jgi:N-acetylglutamate synthase-like GNAT family acetyltransferase
VSAIENRQNTSIVRDYAPCDREECLAIFDSNVPLFFGAHERPLFESWLDDLRGPYLAIEDEGEIIACGGTALHQTEPGAAVLCWGMVTRSRHKSGVGRLLLIERLTRLNRDPSLTVAVVNTSQFSAGFFTRMGFTTRRIIPDGYFAGMNKHEMSVPLPFQIPE